MAGSSPARLGKGCKFHPPEFQRATGHLCARLSSKATFTFSFNAHRNTTHHTYPHDLRVEVEPQRREETCSMPHDYYKVLGLRFEP